DTVAIVHNEAMCALASHARSELLDDPRRGWMFGYIPVHESARADVEHDEDVDQVEAGRHRHKEVAADQLASMIAHERAPRLGRQSGFERTRPAHVAPDSAGRQGDTQLQQQFRGNAVLTPRPVRPRDVGDQLLDVKGAINRSRRLLTVSPG